MHVAEVEAKIAATRCSHARLPPFDPLALGSTGVEPQDRLVRTDDRCAAEEAHRAHHHP